jgi:hypothetical protein
VRFACGYKAVYATSTSDSEAEELSGHGRSSLYIPPDRYYFYIKIFNSSEKYCRQENR